LISLCDRLVLSFCMAYVHECVYVWEWEFSSARELEKEKKKEEDPF
jgi:hypothetical protein